MSTRVDRECPIIIGGGLVGCGLAYQLAKRGWKATLLEQRNIASGASGRNGGMLMKIDGRDTCAAEIARRWIYVQENDRMLNGLAAELGTDFGLWRRGSLDLAVTEAEVELLRKIVKMQREELGDPEVRFLDRKRLQRLSPILSTRCLGARFRPSDGCLDPLQLTHAFCRKARQLGATIHPWTKVKRILFQRGEVTGVVTDRGIFPASLVIITTNGWASYLAPELPVMPLRALAVITEPAPPIPALTFEAELHTKIVYGCTQTRRGNILVGGPPEFPATKTAQFQEQVSFAEMRFNVSIIHAFFPGLRHLNVIRAWSGAMGITPDGLPCVGALAAFRGLYVAAGYPNGMAYTPITARLLAELLVEGESSISLAPLAPDRFAGRKFRWPAKYDYTVLANYLGRTGQKVGRKNE